MKKVGYIRVSTNGQNLARQKVALMKYLPEDMIVEDKKSGKDFEREGYSSLKNGIGKLVKGDELYITSLDRLGRNKGKRQILVRSDTKLPQPFASWSNSLSFTCDF